MLLSAVFFTFNFPFEAQQCCARIVLGTSNMFCFTLWRLFDICKWILVSILFLAVDICCVKSWKFACWIFTLKEDGFTTSIMFISHVACLGLRCFVIYRCLLLLYVFISCLLFMFLIFFNSVNICLQQFTCIMFISRVVGFALFCCLLLFTCSFPSLLFGFSDFFTSLNIFLAKIHLFLKYGY